MPRHLWCEFLRNAQSDSPSVAMVGPSASSAPRTTHLGANKITPYSTFVAICERAGISSTDLDFGRAGRGCGEVLLVPGPINPACVLGASRLQLAPEYELCQHNPVLEILRKTIEAASLDPKNGTVIIVDLKCVRPS
jgi:hypothetical protein